MASSLVAHWFYWKTHSEIHVLKLRYSQPVRTLFSRIVASINFIAIESLLTPLLNLSLTNRIDNCYSAM